MSIGLLFIIALFLSVFFLIISAVVNYGHPARPLAYFLRGTLFVLMTVVSISVFIILHAITCSVADPPARTTETLTLAPIDDSHYAVASIVHHGALFTGADRVFYYYYQRPNGAITQGCIPTAKTTVYYTDDDPRLDIVTVSVYRHYDDPFVYFHETIFKDVVYELHLPKGSIAQQFEST